MRHLCLLLLALENDFIPVAQADFSRTQTANSQGRSRCAVQRILDCGLSFCYKKSGDGE